jgi:hypothetical protein
MVEIRIEQCPTECEDTLALVRHKTLFQHNPSLVCPTVRSLKLTYTYVLLFSVNLVYRPLTPNFETSCPFYVVCLFYGGALLVLAYAHPKLQ